MARMKGIGLTGAVAALVLAGALGGATRVDAATSSDRGAAIVVWPKIVADANGGVDTVMQLMNLNQSQSTAAHCFYVNANSHCTNTGAVCTSSDECASGSSVGACVQDWIEIDFDIVLTPDQPIAWRALEGLGGSDLPCPGGFADQCGANAGGNAGTRIPPVPETPFLGELKCIQVDRTTRLPEPCAASTCRNDLAGSAAIEAFDQSGGIDVKRYNAVGLRTAGANDGDGLLGIGNDPTEGAEYQACSEVLVLDHLFDGAQDPISGTFAASTELTLVPCSQDLLTQQITPVTAQFLVYNEFEQRLSTSRQVRCLFDSVLSLIDTTQPTRSIFSAAVQGTVAGQTRIRGVNGGLIGSALLNYGERDGSTGGAGYNLHQAVDRSDGDLIRIP